MSVSMTAEAVRSLMPDLDLGHRARTTRFARVVAALAEKPGASLPQVFPDRAQYHAALNLLGHPSCSHEALLGEHAAHTLTTVEAGDRPVFFLHDTTLLDFSGHATLEGALGPIGNGGGTGWVCHQTLAVDPATRHVHGLVAQTLHVRPASTAGESVAARRARATRESRLWLRNLAAIGPAPVGATWVHVLDRGGDIYETVEELVRRADDFIVRSAHNRALGETKAATKATDFLHDSLRKRPAATTWAQAIPARPGRPARTATLAASALADATIRRPHVRRGETTTDHLTLHAVRVWEPDPPKGVVAIEWILLTSRPVATPEQVRQVADGYAVRPLIEEYHKVQKHGVRVERPHLHAATRLATLVALQSVLAVALLNLRRAARDPAAAARPAEDVVPPVWVRVLRRHRNVPPDTPWTLGDFVLHLARSAGYFKDPAKQPPGWQTLHYALSQLHALVRYELSTRKTDEL